MFPWFVDLSQQQPIAYTILILAVVVAAGLVVGGFKIRGMSLGTAGVLFVGLLMGQVGQELDPHILHFVKEFGLVLFVFTIGLHLGPGFVDSLRHEGLRLNLLALGVTTGGALLTIIAAKVLPIPAPAAIGLMCGAVTNTPSLGATQQALATIPGLGEGSQDLPAIAYAVAYPGGILGIIAALILLRWWHRVEERSGETVPPGDPIHALERRTLEVGNAYLAGRPIAGIPGIAGSGITVVRHRRNGAEQVQLAEAETVLGQGDRLLLVGPRAALDLVQAGIGQAVDEDLAASTGPITHARLMITGKDAIGKRLGLLGLHERYGVLVTRVIRASVEMPPDPRMRLHFGDILHVVGEDRALEAVGTLVGNKPQALNQTHYAPIFLGIALGVIVGSIPFAIPGLPAPVRLGLAGGPLLIAILLGRVGSFGRIVWHLPAIANHSLRELGIALFLASVGISAGPAFFDTVLTSTGAILVGLGLIITMLPLLIVGSVAVRILRMRYTAVMGLLSGSMTDPPALAFANTIAGNEAPASAYAAVYPLTMILRIILAQVLVVLLCGSALGVGGG